MTTEKLICHRCKQNVTEISSSRWNDQTNEYAWQCPFCQVWNKKTLDSFSTKNLPPKTIATVQEVLQAKEPTQPFSKEKTMTLHMTLQDHLRLYQEAGKSVKALSQKLGMSYTTLRRIAKKIPVTKAAVENAAIYFKVPMQECEEYIGSTVYDNRLGRRHNRKRRMKPSQRKLLSERLKSRWKRVKELDSNGHADKLKEDSRPVTYGLPRFMVIDTVSGETVARF